MRSREISSVIIIQNLAQIRALFKDTWEMITGNCDTMVYLGGNEQSTHEYISKLLGKVTIDKRSSEETRGSRYILTGFPNRMFRMHFTKEQLNEVQRAMLVHVPKDVILSYFYPEIPVAKMMEIRGRYE